MTDITGENWKTELYMRKGMANSFKIKSLLHEEQSKYQKIEVYETEALGRLLLLDGKTMVSNLDEFVYHEVMAHIPTMVIPSVKKVLIIGGGDGGVVREFTRHKEIEQIDLVEIDERVIEVSKEYFPECTVGLDDPRVRVLPQDGIAFLKETKDKYDVIIIDSTDPVDFAEGLFTKEFYGTVKAALTEQGVAMAQTENPFFDEYGIKNIYNNLKENFKNVQSFTAPMPIYPGVFWTFSFCSNGTKGTELIEAKRESMKAIEPDLKWYNMDWHEGAFKLSTFQKRMLGLDS